MSDMALLVWGIGRSEIEEVRLAEPYTPSKPSDAGEWMAAGGGRWCRLVELTPGLEDRLALDKSIEGFKHVAK